MASLWILIHIPDRVVELVYLTFRSWKVWPNNVKDFCISNKHCWIDIFAIEGPIEAAAVERPNLYFSKESSSCLPLAAMDGFILDMDLFIRNRRDEKAGPLL